MNLKIKSTTFTSQLKKEKMAMQTQIIKTAELKGVLSKEQKRFNGYLQKIKTLKLQIEESKEIALELGKLAQSKIRPTEERMFDIWKKFIIHFDQISFANSLKKKQQEKYEAILFELADLFMANAKADTDIKAIFDKFSDESFDDIQAEGNEMGKDYIISMFKEQFDIDIDPDDILDVKDPFNNPKLFEKMAEAKQKHEQKQADAKQQKAERDALKKKSDKQLEIEERKKVAESAISKTTKQIYMDLVKNFHPDTEQDEERKAWKTDIMQQITAAYDEDDYIRLLELQMSLLEDRDNALTAFDDKQLKYFNDALKKQIDELSMKLDMGSPAVNPMFPYAHLFDLNRNRMHYKVNDFLKSIKQQENQYIEWLRMIQTQEGFKDFVKRYELDDDDDLDFGFMMEMLTRRR
jgi:hypothetical protein